MKNRLIKSLSAIFTQMRAGLSAGPGLSAGLSSSQSAVRLAVMAIALFWLIPVATAADQPDHSFPDTSLTNWKEKSFVGNTKYELVPIADQTILMASTDQSASLLYKEKTINLKDTPWIEWSWKVDSVYQDIDERAKSGDDFPARLYVAVQKGFLPWNTVAINYVWSSNQLTGSIWKNPFTDKSMMIAVQGGDEMAGQWVTQRRNIVKDFKQLFDIDVTSLSGYAVMVDGDNSGQKSTAYFGQIDFSHLAR